MTRRGTGRRGGLADRGAADRLTVTRAREHVHLVHRGGTPSRRLAEIADWLGAARPDEAVVLVGAALGTDGVEGLCERLAPLLGKLKGDEVRLLRLVMSAGADEADGRPSTARLICERWELDVLATAGPAVVVPDGTLFSPDLPDAPGGWWYFSVGDVPRPVGSRLPIPDWEPALGRLDLGAVPDHVVEPVPAGLMIRPIGTPSAAVHTLPYAVPPDPGRPHLLVDAPGLPAAGLATVIAALPGRVRKDIRLLSLDGRSLVETGQEVADLLGTDVHVANGVPVVVDEGDEGDVEQRTVSTELYMVDSDGIPAWRPFAQTLTCAPATDGRRRGARVTSWRTPTTLLKGTEHNALPFGQTWKVAVTPAGLWAGPRSSEPPLVAAARTAGADTVALELGTPRRALDDALWPSLDRLFAALEPEVRERAVVHVHGVLGRKGMENLRRLTVRHDFSLMPHTRDEAEAEEQSGVRAGGVRLAPSSAAETFPSLGRTPATGEPHAADAADEQDDQDGQEELREREQSSEAPQAAKRAFPERVVVSVPATEAREVPTQTEPAGPAAVTAPQLAPATVPESAAAPGSLWLNEQAARSGVGRPPTAAVPASSSGAPRTANAEKETAVPSPTRGTSPPPAQETVAPAPSSAAPSPASTPTSTSTDASIPAPAGASAPFPATGPSPTGVTSAPVPANAAGAEPPAAAAGLASGPAPADGSRPRGVIPATEATHSGLDHEKLRAYLGPFWKKHRTAVSQITERLFAANLPVQSDATIAELVAVHVYMTAVDDAQLRAALAEGDDQSRTLLRCLRSGMRRLPSYRGATISTAAELVSRVTPEAVGEEWEGTVPVRAVSVGRAYPGPPTDHVLIWSVTGRRTGTCADDNRQDILFARESRFRVLGVTRHGTVDIGLLQELPQQAHTSSPQLDAALLNRLRAVLDLPAPVPGRDANPPAWRSGPGLPNPGA